MAYFYNVIGKLEQRRLLSSLPEAAVNTGAIIFLFATIIALFVVLKDRSLYRRIFMLICFLQTLLATFLTLSRGALAGLTAATMVLLFLIYRRHWRKFLVTLLVLSVVAGLFVIKTPGLQTRINPTKLSENERFTIWQISIEMIKDRPFHGFGFGMEAFGDTLWDQYKTKVPANWVTDEPYRHPHNFILDIMVRQGILGFVCFASVLFFAFRMGLSALSSGDPFIRNHAACLMAALVGVVVAGLFGKIVSGPSAVILHAILAMITIVYNLEDDKNRRVQDRPTYRSNKLRH
jgi:O-antigen ligase